MWYIQIIIVLLHMKIVATAVGTTNQQAPPRNQKKFEKPEARTMSSLYVGQTDGQLKH